MHWKTYLPILTSKVRHLAKILLIFILFYSRHSWAQVYQWSTIAGVSPGGSDGTSDIARFNNPQGIASDVNGNLYIADFFNNNIRQIMTVNGQSIVSTIAGSPGSSDIGSKDGPGDVALFNRPSAVAVDGLGNVFVFDEGTDNLREISPTGASWTVSTIYRYGIELDGPCSLAVDSSNNIWICALGMDLTKLTLVQNNWIATNIFLLGSNNTPSNIGFTSITTDKSGNLYGFVAGDFPYFTPEIYKLTDNVTNYTTNFVAGGGSGFQSGDLDISYSDGVNSNATFGGGYFSLITDENENIFVVDQGNSLVREISAVGTNWVVTTIAGRPGLTSDSIDGIGSNAEFDSPGYITRGPSGSLYVSENSAIRTLHLDNAGWNVSTFAGAPSRGDVDGIGISTHFWDPNGLATQGKTILYIADTGNSLVRKLTYTGSEWVSSTLAGLTNAPYFVAVDSVSNLYVSESYNHTISKMTPGGSVSIFAGSPGQAGTNDGVGTNALFAYPQAIAIDSNNFIYVADEYTIRQISPTGSVITIAGAPGVNGAKDGIGKVARFSPTIQGIFVDSKTNIYVADSNNQDIRQVRPSGTSWQVTTIAGKAGSDNQLDGTNNTARFQIPRGLTADPDGNLLVADLSTIRKIAHIETNWVVTTIGGVPGENGSSDGAANAATFIYPSGIACNEAGLIFVADANGNDVRMGSSASETPQISFYRCNSSAILCAPSDGIDDPLVLITNINILASQVVGQTPAKGLVADGVSPLLISLALSETPAISQLYKVTFSLNGTQLTTGWTNNLFIYDSHGWTSTNLINITSTNSFAYLNGLRYEDLIPYFGEADELNIQLNLTPYGQVAPTVTASFLVRPPPVVLIHGYNANSSSWSDDFKNELLNYRPSDFLFAIDYATNNDNFGNTTFPLDYLSATLDLDLRQQVEQKLMGWAYTRYDVVGHSQGGVLARMLCQTSPNGNPAFGSPLSTPIVSKSNFYRGRFRRIITIGSPHNGSLLLHYILQMTHSFNPLHHFIPYFLGHLAQDKFDPFGCQIDEINNPILTVDPRIKFACIQTTINSGNPPNNLFADIFATDIDSYGALGLETAAGVTVLPKGSDGVVDFLSQGGGAGTTDYYINSPDISHADVTSADGSFELFHVPPGHSQTTYAPVADQVISLLNGPASAFSSFTLPSLLTSAQKSAIDSVIPVVIPTDLIFSGASTLDLSTNYNYSIQAADGLPSGEVVTWYAQVYGSNGITLQGISLVVNPTNSTQVTISVANGLQGTIVLFAYYSTTNGSLIMANPVVVVSNPIGPLTGIQLQSPSAVLSIGQTLSLTIYGTYTNGLSSALYLSTGQGNFVSSNPSVASVDAHGNVTMNGFGTATIIASYNGFTAQTVVSTAPPTISSFSAAILPNRLVQLSFMATLGTTNIIQASTNLISWFPIATLVNTNGFQQYIDTNSYKFSKIFYRVEIPVAASANNAPFVLISSAAMTTNGNLVFTLIGTANVTNIVQTTGDLKTWTLLTNIFNSNGIVNFVDPSLTRVSQKFYRVIIPR